MSKDIRETEKNKSRIIIQQEAPVLGFLLSGYGGKRIGLLCSFPACPVGGEVELKEFGRDGLADDLLPVDIVKTEGLGHRAEENDAIGDELRIHKHRIG